MFGSHIPKNYALLKLAHVGLWGAMLLAGVNLFKKLTGQATAAATAAPQAKKKPHYLEATMNANGPKGPGNLYGG